MSPEHVLLADDRDVVVDVEKLLAAAVVDLTFKDGVVVVVVVVVMIGVV